MLKTAFCRNFKGRNLMAKEMIAMILAGARLASVRADPEARQAGSPFGGKYRIIDFPLSNCVNSDIDTVGILTQYQPLVLNEYIGNGQPWDLDRLHGGVHVLPPYQQVPALTGTRALPTQFTRTFPSLTVMTRSTSSSCPATRFASRITLISCASTKRRTPSSRLPLWKCLGAKPRALV